MSKYTETLIDYMRAGGVLPALFEQIDGFPQLFVQRFCDYEIGFETPELFAQKLEGAAKRFVPFYKTLIQSQNDLIAKLTTSYNRVHTTTSNLGEQESLSWVYPYNAASNTNPAARTLATPTTNTTTEASSGYTPDELARMIELAGNIKNNLLDELLSKFKHCFMIVF